MASREWGPVSYGRSAIEQHEQDHHPETIDVLIDAAREALEYLATNSPSMLDAWIERLIASDVPVLRRLAIHAFTVHPNKSPDEKIKWLLGRVGLHDFAEHHEVHRAVALSYAHATEDVRQTVDDRSYAGLCNARSAAIS